MLSIHQKIKRLCLPRADEWLWDIHGLTDNVLRTACLHEFVRETECLVSRVEKIDALMKRLGCSSKDIRKLLSHGLSRFVEPPDSEFELQAQLINHLTTLASAVHPLSPHVLLGRQLRSTPFFSLREEFMTDEDLLTDATAEQLEDEPLEKARGINISKLSHCIQFSGAWVTTLRTDTADCFTSVRSRKPLSCGATLPPDEFFDRDDGSRTSETTIAALVAPLDVFISNHPIMLARALIRRNEPPKHLSGKVFRFEAEISIGYNELSVISDFDGLGLRPEVEEFVVVATRVDADVHAVLAALKTIKDNAGEHKAVPPSILSEFIRVNKNKPNRTFYLKALCTISALRMGHTIENTHFGDMIELFKGISKEERKANPIPYTNLTTVMESLTQYRETAKSIFPTLMASELEPRTKLSGRWTIKR